MDADVLEQLLMALYDAASGRRAWGDVMTQTAAALDAWAVQMIGVDKLTGTVIFSHDGGRATPESSLDYIRKYHAENPRISAVLALGPDEWLHDHEVFDEVFVANSAFYRDFLIPYGGRYLSGTKIIDDEHQMILFGAMRGVGQKPFDAREREQLQRLKIHLTHAIGIQTHLRIAHADMQAGVALLNQFDRPMILIDAERSIRFKNAAAERALAAGEYVRERHGTLHCRDSSSDTALAVAVRELQLLAGLHSDRPPPSRRFLRTRAGSGGTPIGIYLVALRPELTMNTFGHEPRALVFFHDFRDSSGLDALVVAETFDLTPAEARVAVALASGSELSEIAERHHVSIATVRAQLSAVFSKTGTSRQADLVRLLVAMPALTIGMRPVVDSASASARKAPRSRIGSEVAFRRRDE